MKDETARIEALARTLDAGDIDLGETLVAPQDRTAALDATSARLPIFDTAERSEQLQIGATIAEGGMGLVRQADQPTLRRTVAVKTIREEREGPETNTELLHEAVVTGLLEHPNIVPVYSLFESRDGAPIIVMKLIEGEPWHDCIHSARNLPDEALDDPLGWHLQVFEDVCRAAHFAHERGIVHRDIKPSNVMIGTHGEVYLFDWGVAVTVDDDRANYLIHARDTRQVVGTPVYLAPEMAAADGEAIGPRTDVYLLGATLYHVLAGDAPHVAPTIHQVLMKAYQSAPPQFGDDVPHELAAICRRAMARDPEDRYATADELRRAVQTFRSHRASIELAHQATTARHELEELVADGAPEASIREKFDEARFGFEHALQVWDDNPEAVDGLRAITIEMAWKEVRSGRLESVESHVIRLKDVPTDLREAVETLRAEAAEEREEIEGLRELERDTSIQTGANYRMWGAAIAWGVLTVAPLLGRTVVDPLGTELGTFVLHGGLMCFILCTLVFFFRGGLFANEANKRIALLIIVFALSLPLMRYVSWQSGLTIAGALSMEAAGYTVAYAAMGLLSRFSPWLGAAAYAAAAIVGSHLPEWIFVCTSLSNFLALGYVVVAFRKQRMG